FRKANTAPPISSNTPIAAAKYPRNLPALPPERCVSWIFSDARSAAGMGREMLLFDKCNVEQENLYFQIRVESGGKTRRSCVSPILYANPGLVYISRNIGFLPPNRRMAAQYRRIPGGAGRCPRSMLLS